ncbi:hypothetical protein EZMO1_0891 [Endozoicomonas montiporae CL-33]|uniref:Uncharacterized protein n=1 Tax=Endozoicomonas montiporae CL-33 TaxID=570277 RepID=A0A142B8N1_9GAMM|nr:hypothetical protein [Endozoicomonas montiporae]AMO55107.1 hypothetical protein EZMO1_0891 [Endozoicomonas montiporae CL-33]
MLLVYEISGLSTASRAMIAGAMVGGGASIARHWQAYKQGELESGVLVADAARSALQVGAVSGATNYVAEKMAGRPVLSMLTVLSAGAAGFYLLDQLLDNKHNDQT